MQKLFLCIVTLAVLIGCTMAVPIPTTPLPLFSSTQSINIYGSSSQCCGGGTTIDSTSTMTRSTVPAVNATLMISGSCSGSSCDCYSSYQAQRVLDLTPLYDSCPGGSVQVQCILDLSCQYTVMNISYIQANKGIDQGQYWPSPLNAACSSNTATSCADVTYLKKYEYVCNVQTMEYCTVNIPLLDPALTGGALLMTMYIIYGSIGGCGEMDCGYGGGGSYYTTCTLGSLTCP
jgi:hypothetical protein